MLCDIYIYIYIYVYIDVNIHIHIYIYIYTHGDDAGSAHMLMVILRGSAYIMKAVIMIMVCSPPCVVARCEGMPWSYGSSRYMEPMVYHMLASIHGGEMRRHVTVI